jgi:hypothetical protein
MRFKEGGLSTGALIGIVVAVVVPVIIAVVLIGGGIIGGGNKVEITFTPSTVHVGDNYSLAVSVTNKESGTMTITGGTMKIYRNDQLMDTDTGTTGWENTIPAGQTVYILPSHTYTVSSTSSYGGVSYSNVADWRIELSINTNYGTLTDSCSWTVLA